jgi:hypothetical protein
MQTIKIIDEKKYPLPNINKDSLPYYRYEHRATLSRLGKVYIVFVDHGIRAGDKIIKEPVSFIEDISTGNMQKIKEDELWVELAIFATENGFLEIQMPMMKLKK